MGYAIQYSVYHRRTNYDCQGTPTLWFVRIRRPDPPVLRPVRTGRSRRYSPGWRSGAQEAHANAAASPRSPGLLASACQTPDHAHRRYATAPISPISPISPRVVAAYQSEDSTTFDTPSVISQLPYDFRPASRLNPESTEHHSPSSAGTKDFRQIRMAIFPPRPTPAGKMPQNASSSRRSKGPP